MGSLSSRPEIPAQPQVVYMPTPVYAPSSSSPSAPAPSGSSPTPEQAAAQGRTASLLQRSRSRFGTVQTSFRGLLELAGNAAGRKTLLGE